MRLLSRIAVGVVSLALAVAVLPPLFYAVFPYDWPDLPPAGRRLPVGNGLFVDALDRGVGPVVVLVHGLPGLAHDWRALVPALAERGRRVIAYDRIGYGRSDGRPDAAPSAFTVDANARELVALLENEGIEDATVVGWSYGGPIGIEAAVLDAEREPKRIARLVLVGTGGPDSDDGEPPPAPGALTTAVLRWIGSVPPVAAAAQRAASEQAFSGGPQPDWWLPSLQVNFAAPHTRATWVAEAAALQESAAFRAAEVAVPTLLVHGDDDRLAPLAIAEYVHRKVPGARLEVVPGGSHMLPVTHAEQLADWIAAF